MLNFTQGKGVKIGKLFQDSKGDALLLVKLLSILPSWKRPSICVEAKKKKNSMSSKAHLLKKLDEIHSLLFIYHNCKTLTQKGTRLIIEPMVILWKYRPKFPLWSRLSHDWNVLSYVRDNIWVIVLQLKNLKVTCFYALGFMILIFDQELRAASFQEKWLFSKKTNDAFTCESLEDWLLESLLCHL